MASTVCWTARDELFIASSPFQQIYYCVIENSGHVIKYVIMLTFAKVHNSSAR